MILFKRRFLKKVRLAAFLAQFLATSAFASDDPGLSSIRESALKGHVSFLASDEMAGRDSLSPEGRIAAEYIAGFFRRAELEPVADEGTFFQNFPMVEAHVDRANVRLRASIANAAGTFERDYALAGPISRSLDRVESISRRELLSSSPAMESPPPSSTTTTSLPSTSPERWCSF